MYNQFDSDIDSDIDFIEDISIRFDRKFKERTNFLETLNDTEFLKRFRIRG